MKKIILMLTILQFSFINANAQWVIQYSVISDVSVNSMQFVDENTGYAVCEGPSTTYGYIYKTTNGGINWNNLSLPYFMYSFRLWELSFINANTGFVCGHSMYIYKTTDGGNNWNYFEAPLYQTQTYGAIQFFNEQTGYIAGRYGMHFKTTNGGSNWFTYDTAYTSILNLYYADHDYGFMVDSYSGVYKTTNGSITWNYQYLTDTSSGAYLYAFQKIKFINYNTGYIVGTRVSPERGAIFKTTNGGINWKNIYITPNNGLYSLALVDSSAIYVGSFQKIIFKSTNGGKSWISQQLPTYWSVTLSVVFTNTNTGFCCAGNDIMKTTNGGSVFVKNISSEIPDGYGYRLFQNYPNPFNQRTIIKYQCTIKSDVTLKIYDISGKHIKTLINQRQSPGIYEIRFDADNLSSGIYFYSLIVDGKMIDTKKLILIK